VGDRARTKTGRQAEADAKAAKAARNAARIEAFAATLAETMQEREMTQVALGDALGLTQSAVSSWRTGEAIPDWDTVFEIEVALQLSPGYLSRHLGYYPPTALKGGGGVEAEVKRDPLLDAPGKRVILAIYHDLTTRARQRRGRPAKTR